MSVGAAAPLTATTPAGPRRRRRDPAPIAPVLLLAVILSGCSILYELLAAQTLSLLAANTVVWYSLTVGTFLASMGLGAWLSGRVADERLWPALFRVEIALTLVGAALVPLLHLAHALYSYLDIHERPELGLAGLLGTALLLVVTVGVLTGIELPLLMRLGGGERNRPAANLVLGFDYLGALAGAVLFPIVLLPRLSLLTIGLLAAAVNFLVALVVLVAWLERRRAAGAVAAGVGALLLAGLVQLRPLDAWLLKSYYYYIEASDDLATRFGSLAQYPDVVSTRSPYQRIDLMRDVAPDYSATIMPAYSSKLARDPEYPVDWILCLNGAFQTNTRYDEVYHEWFAHVPIIARGTVPRSVLLLGGGDGLLMRELVKHDGIESITHVDIDEALIALAMNHPVLRHANANALRDGRIERIIGDGFAFARESDRTFDAIYIDFPRADDYDLAKLYSREFFHHVRERLADGGFAVFDATGISLLSPPDASGRRDPVPGNAWPIYYHTLRAAGFPTIQPFLTSLGEVPGAVETLARSGIELAVDQQVVDLLARTDDPERRDEIVRAVLERLVDAHVIALEQGFIMLADDTRPLRTAWRDPEVPLVVLDEVRYGITFDVAFPAPAEIDPARVNSILRPTLPTTPWWEPRQPF